MAKDKGSGGGSSQPRGEAAAVKSYVGSAKRSNAGSGTNPVKERAGSDAKKVNAYVGGALRNEIRNKNLQSTTKSTTGEGRAERRAESKGQSQYAQEASQGQQTQQGQAQETKFSDEANKGGQEKSKEQQEATRYTREANEENYYDPEADKDFVDVSALREAEAQGKAEDAPKGSAWAKQRAEEESSKLADLQADRLRANQIYTDMLADGRVPSAEEMEALGLKTLEEYDDAIEKAQWSADYFKKLAETGATDAERDALLGQYNQANTDFETYAGYAVDPLTAAAMDQQEARVEDLEGQLKEKNRELGNTSYTGLADYARGKDFVENWQGERGAQYGAALGTAAEWLGDKINNTSYTVTDPETGEEREVWNLAGKGDGLQEWGATVFQNAREQNAEAQQDWADVTEGMSAGEQQALGIAKTFGNTAEDAVVNFLTLGVGGKVLMGARAGGAGALEQDSRENNDLDSRAAKMFLDGGVAFLSEWMVGGAEGAYGKSVFGRALSDFVGKGISNPVTRRILFNTEGLQEGLEYGLTLLGDKLLGLDPNAEWSTGEFAQNVAVGYFMGLVFNGLSAGQEITPKKMDSMTTETGEVTRGVVKGEIDLPSVMEETMNRPGEVTIKPGKADAEAEANAEVGADTAAPEVGATAPEAAAPEAEAPAVQPGQTPMARAEKDNTGTAWTGDWNSWVDAALSGGALSDTDVDTIYNRPAARAAFEEATGISLDGMSEEDAKSVIGMAAGTRARPATGEPAAQIQTERNPEAETGENTERLADVPQGTGAVVPETGAVQTDEAATLAGAAEGGTNPNPGQNPENPVGTLVNAAEGTQGQSGATTPGNAGDAVEGGLNRAETNEGGNPLVTAAEGNGNGGDAGAKPETETGNRSRGPSVPNPNENTDSDYDALLKASGAIEQGENPARDIQVPKKDSKGMKTGEGVRTVMEASATPEERIASLKAAVVNGNFGHIPVDNDTRSNNAQARIARDGWSKAASDFVATVNTGKVDADTIALGAHLLNQAGNSPDCNGRAYIELAMAYNDAVSGTAQGLQAARILKTLTPEGKLYGMEKTVEKMNDEIRKNNEKRKRGKPQKEIKLNEDLVEEYLAAETDEAREEARQKLVKDTAAQVPNTFSDKITALRYLNMLGNFKTQVRNVAGNTFMTLTQKVKNEVRSGIEGIAEKATRGKYERQYKGGYGGDRLSTAWADFGSDEDIKTAAKGEKKWSSASQQANAEIQAEREYFSNKHPVGKLLNAYNKATGWAMDAGDVVFLRTNYADALAGYMNAHGWTAADWKAMTADPSKADAVDKARNFAIKQAQEATFRDTNGVSKALSNFDKGWSKAGKAAASGVIPFRKTPANVAVRMEEYSPLGIINTLYKGFNVENGRYEVSDVIDSASKSLTGTALTVLGILAAAHNKARTEDDDDDEARFNKLRGKQDYSVEIGGTSITMDWLSPVSAPFFMGVEAWNMAQEGGFQVKDLLDVALSVTSPMMEMSMLSGVNDALANLSEFDGDNSALPQFLLNSAWSYLTQIGSNTFLGQVEQFSEKNRQTYYTDSDNPFLPGWMQKDIAKLGNKTPGVDYQAADYIDAWGRKQASDPNLGKRAWNTFLNPSYVSNLDEKATAADEVIAGLLSFGKNQTEKDQFPDVVPKTPSRSTTVNGKKLTPEEYETYAVTKGQESLKAVTDLIESEVFQNMDEFGQAEAIQEAYRYAEFLAGTKIAEARGEEYTGTGSAAERYAAVMDLDDPVAVLTTKTAYDNAVDAEDWDAVDALLKVALGKGGEGELSDEGMDYLISKDSKINYYIYLADKGVPTRRAKEFDADMEELYTSEKRDAPRSTDYLRTATSGKYSSREADAIMSYERDVSAEALDRYQSQIQYQLQQAGKTGMYSTIAEWAEDIQAGDKTMDDFRAWARNGKKSGLPLKQANEIADVLSTWTSDRHAAGKTVAGIYEAARSVGYTPEQVGTFFEHLDTNYNGSYSKSEIDAAVAWALGYDKTYTKRYYGNTYRYYTFSGAAKKLRDGIRERIGK